jgi:hypothetical protein
VWPAARTGGEDEVRHGVAVHVRRRDPDAAAEVRVKGHEL